MEDNQKSYLKIILSSQTALLGIISTIKNIFQDLENWCSALFCNICLLMMLFKKYHNNGEKVDKFRAKIIYYFHNMNGTLPL